MSPKKLISPIHKSIIPKSELTNLEHEQAQCEYLENEHGNKEEANNREHLEFDEEHHEDHR